MPGGYSPLLLPILLKLATHNLNILEPQEPFDISPVVACTATQRPDPTGRRQRRRKGSGATGAGGRHGAAAENGWAPSLVAQSLDLGAAVWSSQIGAGTDGKIGGWAWNTMRMETEIAGYRASEVLGGQTEGGWIRLYNFALAPLPWGGQVPLQLDPQISYTVPLRLIRLQSIEVLPLFKDTPMNILLLNPNGFKSRCSSRHLQSQRSQEHFQRNNEFTIEVDPEDPTHRGQRTSAIAKRCSAWQNCRPLVSTFNAPSSIGLPPPQHPQDRRKGRLWRLGAPEIKMGYGRLAELDDYNRCIKALPSTLPECTLPLDKLEPSAADEDTYGERGAINRALELSFGSRAAADWGLKFRGRDLVAVGTVLRRVITGPAGDNVLFIKWVDDLTTAAKQAIEASGGKIPRPIKSTAKQALRGEEKAEEEKEMVRKVKAGREEERKKKAKKSDPGRLADELLELLTIKCKVIAGDGKDDIRWRCSQPECPMNWADPRMSARVYHHAATKCKTIDAEMKRRVILKIGKRSLTTQLADAEEMDDDESDDEVQIVEEPEQAGGEGSSKGLEMKKKTDLKTRQTRGNLLTLNFICDTASPVAIVDNPAFRALMAHENPLHGIHTASTFSNNHIPFESARITEERYEHLRGGMFHGVSFNGGSLLRQSAEMVHMTEHVPDEGRESFLVHGDESSGVSHTGVHLAGIVDEPLQQVGPECFGYICSDNTGNTTVAREIINEKYPWIVILRDPCHHLSNTIKNICRLEYFVEVIENFKGAIKHFSQSLYASTHLRAVRVSRDINRGLETVGNTRFATLYWSGYSFERCLPAIVQLVESHVVDARKDSSPLHFMHSLRDSTQFRIQLAQLNRVLEPIARSIKCLEGLDVTLADVFKFYVAITAVIQDLFRENSEGYPMELMESIRQIVNSRFDEMIGDDLGTIYLTHFYLDPDNINSPILRRKTANILDAGTDAPVANPEPSDDTLPDQDLRDSFPAYEPVGRCLGRLLHAELQRAAKYQIDVKECRPYDTSTDALSALKVQFEAFTRQSPDWRTRAPTRTIYWAQARKSSYGNLLGYLVAKMDAMLPTSIAEERTMSTISRMNTKDRASQDAQTVIAMAKIREHIRRANKPKRKRNTTTLNWRSVQAHLQPNKVAKTTTESTPNTAKAAAAAESEKLPPPGLTADAEAGLDALASEGDEHTPCSRSSWNRGSFEIEKVVDVSLASLRDLLSDTPLGSQESSGSAGIRRYCGSASQA
ncbi:DUF659 family protein [Mycena chlorophos]|uniref:DUF659 family protein n=1 Tax=Mycena chlorophos TaxID=658473 RepID=A0A8H6SAE9_MYCCL|nr:DUF659 family protein [Mycena chlorophos]